MTVMSAMSVARCVFIRPRRGAHLYFARPVPDEPALLSCMLYSLADVRLERIRRNAEWYGRASWAVAACSATGLERASHLVALLNAAQHPRSSCCHQVSKERTR